MKIIFQTVACIFAACIMLSSCDNAGKNVEKPYSQNMVESRALRTFLCNTRENQLEKAQWDYVSGLVACSVLKAYQQYPEKTEYYNAAKSFADNNLLPGDSVHVQASNIDDLAAGKIFFTLWLVETKKGNLVDAARYKNAATWLRNQLKYHHRRIEASKPAAGRFIHKAIYPDQIWLDGLYMGPALYAEWQHFFGAEEDETGNTDSWTDIALQFEITHQYTYDAGKQLNYHGWAADPDDPNAFWAKKEEPNKGCSPEFWGRGMGWYFAALVDVLEWMPQSHPHYPRLVEIAGQIAQGLAKYQDKESGCWYQLLQYDNSKTADNTGDELNGTVYNRCDQSNYLESSASSMFTYAYLKGVRLGILDKTTYFPVAGKAYQGLLNTFIRTEDDGYLSIVSSCASAGLGPARDPSRTGTVNYYLCGKDTGVTQNEGKAIGPFIMASLEMELAEMEPVTCVVTNPLNSLRKDEPVVIRYADIRKEAPNAASGFIAVFDGATEICSQQDDLDGDGIWDELVFLTDLLPKEKKTFTLHFNNTKGGKSTECVKEVNAQMFFNNPDRSITPTIVASSTADNMYNRMYHHGPAWESDKIAYRLYFDKKTTVDVYGKKKYRLELADTKWYPTAEQLADKYGDDILWVGNSVGVGTLKGWDGKEATHIDPMNRRTARIVVNGNLRTVVDMAVEGWQYQGQSIDVTARYIQYARHRDMVAQVIIGEPAAQGNLNFSTGVQKVRQSETFIDNDGLIAVWGTEYPTPDTLRYARETFGLGVVVPKKYIQQHATDPINHLIVLKNNQLPVIEYYITAASQKEEQGYKTASEFFAYMQEWKQIVCNPISIKVKKIK